MPRKLIAGNWKMNGTATDLACVQALLDFTSNALAIDVQALPDIVICPPATLVERAARLVATGNAQHLIALGGQDCHAAVSGAHTGDISAAMLKEAGAQFVILGHSERRLAYGETSQAVAAKASAAINAGLTPIICVGERADERDRGQTMAVVLEQLRHSLPAFLPAAAGEDASKQLVIAYEPVWAIGTGRTPTPEQIAEVHHALRQALLAHVGVVASTIRLLYGGSVKPENAKALLHLAHVDGALVGGASLKAADFIPIIQAAAA